VDAQTMLCLHCFQNSYTSNQAYVAMLSRALDLLLRHGEDDPSLDLVMQMTVVLTRVIMCPITIYTQIVCLGLKVTK